jgi:hypothetical protein
MIYLTKGATSEIILTLKEKQTLTSPNYLFYFKGRGSNKEVKFVILNASDTSQYKDRFNQFSIVTNTYFENYQDSEWDYKIYEQTSSSNLNPSLATGLLEVGIMRLSTINGVLQVNIFSEDLEANTDLLLVDNEDFNGYLANNPNNEFIVPEQPDNDFIANNPNNEFIVL